MSDDQMNPIDVTRYGQAAHAMQSGVKYEIETQGEAEAAANPKHLRVGVNSALVGNAALAKLLIDKGIFTLDEYGKVLADEMEREVARYEDRAPDGVHFA